MTQRGGGRLERQYGAAWAPSLGRETESHYPAAPKGRGSLSALNPSAFLPGMILVSSGRPWLLLVLGGGGSLQCQGELLGASHMCRGPRRPPLVAEPSHVSHTWQQDPCSAASSSPQAPWRPVCAPWVSMELMDGARRELPAPEKLQFPCSPGAHVSSVPALPAPAWPWVLAGAGGCRLAAPTLVLPVHLASCRPFTHARDSPAHCCITSLPGKRTRTGCGGTSKALEGLQPGERALCQSRGYGAPCC